MSQPADQNHASEDALVAYALWPDTVEEAIAHHISRCQICMREVIEIAAVHHALKKKLARFDCPSVEELTAYALTELALWDRVEIKTHVRNCPRCTQEVLVTQEVLEVSLPVARIWQTAPRVPASLLPQSGTLRHRGDPPQIFRAGENEIIVSRYEAERGKFLLTGGIRQATQTQSPPSPHPPPAPPPTPLAARLLRIAESQQPVLVCETPIDADGFFEMDPVPPGRYKLEILLSDRLLEMGILEL